MLHLSFSVDSEELKYIEEKLSVQYTQSPVDTLWAFIGEKVHLLPPTVVYSVK